MSGKLLSALALAVTRSQKLMNDAQTFVSNNGKFTLEQRKEGIELLVSLISLQNEFKRIDEEWGRIIKSIVDAKDREAAEALHHLHAFETKDPDKVPYYLVIWDISDIMADVEHKIMLSTMELNKIAFFTKADADAAIAIIQGECDKAIKVASSVEQKNVSFNDQLSHHAIAVHDVEEKVTCPTAESSFTQKENPSKVLLDDKGELPKSSPLMDLEQIVSKIKIVAKKKLVLKERQFLKNTFFSTLVKKREKVIDENHEYDFINDHFCSMIEYAVKGIIPMNYKKRKRQNANFPSF